VTTPTDHAVTRRVRLYANTPPPLDRGYRTRPFGESLPAWRDPVPVSSPVRMTHPHARACSHSGISRSWARISGDLGQDFRLLSRNDISGVIGTQVIVVAT